MNPLTLFLLRLGIVIVPLALLAWWKRIYPHQGLVLLAVVPALGSLVLLVSTRFFWPLLVLDGIVAAVAIVDLFSLPRKRDLSVERTTGRAASLRKPHPVTLTVTNYSKRARFLWLRDGCPYELAPEPEEFQVLLAPRSRVVAEYRLHARRRGAFELANVFARVRSRMGLWQRHLIWRRSWTINVYPDMQQLAQYAILARTDRLSLLGVKRTRRIGQDNEFERLRDYTLDDNYRHIEWKSTARRGKLTVKDFQQNQSQRVIFLVDCGRMMVTQAQSGLSLLDHALNSMLMLSYVAISHGDSVGLLCFADDIQNYVPPRGGKRQMNRLLHGSFDRFAGLVESRYDQAFLYLSQHCHKRSLVVLITNLIDEVNANQIISYLGSLARNHLPLVVLLRDRELFQTAETAQPQGSNLYQAAAAADLLAWRQQALADMHAHRALTLDCYPEDLTARLVNRYLAIKARQLL